jgi:hypothetical protein
MKNLNLCIVFILFETLAFAQKSRLEFGIESGVNISKVQKYSWENIEVPLQSSSWLGGRQIAWSLRYRIAPKWRLKLEYGYVQKGWKGQRSQLLVFCGTGLTPEKVAQYQKENRDYLMTQQDNRLHFEKVPLLVEYSFWRQRMYAQFGGYWARQVFYESYFPNDFGASIGLGVKVQLFKWLRINLDTRYSHGFSDIFRETVTTDFGSFSVTNPVYEKAKGNQTLGINVGLFFTRH